MRHRLQVFLTVLILLTATSHATRALAQKPAEGGTAAAEKALRHSIQKEWLDLAALAISKSARATASMALLEASGFDPDPQRYSELQEKSRALEGNVESRIVDRRATASRKRVVSLLNRLADLAAPADKVMGREAYLWRALQIDTSNKGSLRILRRSAANAAQAGDLARTRRLLAKAKTYDLEAISARKYLLAEGLIGRMDKLLVKAPGHSMLAWLLLPPGWKPKGRWKMLVHVEGASCGFEEAMKDYRKLLREHAYMVLVPATFSQTDLVDFERSPYDIEVINTQLGNSTKGRLQFDVAGLTGILEQVRSRFLGEKTFYLTGHAEGGILVNWWIHHHPEQIRGAAPVSGTYRDLCSDGGVSPRAKGPWVRLLTAARDPEAAGKLEQTARAVQRDLTASGFKRVETRRVAGPPGDRLTKEVMGFFEEISRKPR